VTLTYILKTLNLAIVFEYIEFVLGQVFHMIARADPILLLLLFLENIKMKVNTQGFFYQKGLLN
jgi:hypothetical protein